MSRTTFVKGDLFEWAETAAKAGPVSIGHGVNCRGVMGAGVAKAIRQRYPWCYDNYARACSVDAHNLAGTFMTVHSPYGKADTDLIGVPSVVHLFTQIDPGANATYDLIVKSLYSYLNSTGRPLFIPLIGGGIGGLDPARLLRDFEALNSPKLVVVTP